VAKVVLRLVWPRQPAPLPRYHLSTRPAQHPDSPREMRGDACDRARSVRQVAIAPTPTVASASRRNGCSSCPARG
jgi:hypothetical protein